MRVGITDLFDLLGKVGVGRPTRHANWGNGGVAAEIAAVPLALQVPRKRSVFVKNCQCPKYRAGSEGPQFDIDLIVAQ